LADDVCKADTKAIAKELDAGLQSSVDFRPCLNTSLPADPRYKQYVSEAETAKAEGNADAALNAYSKFYREVLGPAQTEFWRSVNQQLSPKGLCHLDLVMSQEFPKIAEHVEINCGHEEDSTPMS